MAILAIANTRHVLEAGFMAGALMFAADFMVN
jgi:hypothetical protein